MARVWTAEQRLMQSQAIKKWQPWLQSTGAKTEEGKKTVSQNAFKGGIRPLFRNLSKALRHQKNVIYSLN